MIILKSNSKLTQEQINQLTFKPNGSVQYDGWIASQNHYNAFDGNDAYVDSLEWSECILFGTREEAFDYYAEEAAYKDGDESALIVNEDDDSQRYFLCYLHPYNYVDNEYFLGAAETLYYRYLL